MSDFPTSVTRWLRDSRVQRRLAILALAAIALVGPSITPSSSPASGPETVAIQPRRAQPPVRRIATPSRFPKALTDADLNVFRGLGAWVDLFDVNLDAEAYVAQMQRNGVSTLYLQTGRTNTATQIDPQVGPWLAAAHDAGMRVVGWYLPFYSKPELDLARSLAVATYRYGTHRFDGLGIDIEYRAAVQGTSTWNRKVAKHLATVRRELGPGYPLAAIPPTPLQMRVAPEYWAGFPWASLGAHADAILLMSYWSDRIGCPQVRAHCPYEFTARNIEITRRLIGRSDRIIHVIGGVGDEISGSEVRDFVRGALDASADGASMYDARTTDARWWRQLSDLRRLGR